MRHHRPSCLEGPRSRTLRKGGRRAKPEREEKGIRQELVDRIRAELAAGTYLTADKWETAFTRLTAAL